MPFTIHLDPGVILPFCTCFLCLLLLYFVLTLILFQFWAKQARGGIAQKSVTYIAPLNINVVHAKKTVCKLT
jgi:hypothetical protein